MAFNERNLKPRRGQEVKPMGFLDNKRGYAQAEKVRKEMDAQRASGIQRVWLPVGKETTVVFLDDNPPIIKEHQVKINGDWKHWFTCLREVGASCPICNDPILRNRAYAAGFYTVIDTTEYTTSKGEARKNQLRLFVAKDTTLQKLRRESDKRKKEGKNGLVGAMYTLYRTDKKSPSVGDDFTYMRTLTDEEIKGLNKDAKVVDYEAVLKPKDREEILAALSASAATVATADDLADAGDNSTDSEEKVEY